MAASKSFSKIVHAYRRTPEQLVHPGPNNTEVKKHVEVHIFGQKVKFLDNEAGHVVATVTDPEVFDHLTKTIPEAYVEYRDGDNVPERTSEVSAKANKPAGKFVLTNGSETKVLDAMSDAELREFAKAAGIEDEALPNILSGDTLRGAIFNTLGGQ